VHLHKFVPALQLDGCLALYLTLRPASTLRAIRANSRQIGAGEIYKLQIITRVYRAIGTKQWAGRYPGEDPDMVAVRGVIDPIWSQQYPCDCLRFHASTPPLLTTNCTAARYRSKSIIANRAATLGGSPAAR
jgi:hypothetical protein